MLMRCYLRYFASFLCIGILLVLTACSKGAKWVEEAQGLLHSQEAKPAIRAWVFGQKKAVTPLGDILKRAPTTPTAEEAATLQRLRQLAAYDADVSTAGDMLDSHVHAMPQRIKFDAMLASVKVDSGIRTKVINHLTEHGQDIIKDTACELAWNQMTGEEHSEANSLIASGDATPTNSNQLAGVGSKAYAAAVDAIVDDAEKAFLKLSYPAKLVDWAAYAKGLYNKAGELQVDGRVTIPHPDGAITRAYVYYARLCLAPPK
jgi:hypothetical protein